MGEQSTLHPTSLIVGPDQPLIGIVRQEDGREVTHYFGDEAAADAATTDQAALAAIGSWSDLHWEETVEVLEQIRRESTPTPPIEHL
jgi:hypothetical protein